MKSEAASKLSRIPFARWPPRPQPGKAGVAYKEESCSWKLDGAAVAVQPNEADSDGGKQQTAIPEPSIPDGAPLVVRRPNGAGRENLWIDRPFLPSSQKRAVNIFLALRTERKERKSGFAVNVSA